MKVVAWRRPGDGHPVRKTVKVGEETEFELEGSPKYVEIEGSPKYVVKAWWGKSLVDEETEAKKTGR